MPDGKILVVGGARGNSWPVVSLDEVVLYDPSGNGSVTPLASMLAKRFDHQSIMLSSGKVLISGGRGENGVELNSVELYDPTNGGETTLLAPMAHSRYGHSSILLSNGKVLMVSGYGDVIGSVELYDPSGGGSTVSLTDLRFPRVYFTAHLLPSGKVIVLGGMDDSSGVAINKVELYDPSGLGSSVELTDLKTVRAEHTSVLLDNGKLLLVGGWDNSDPSFVSKIEIYDPISNGGIGSSVHLNDELPYILFGSSATKLNGGRVWISCGRRSPGNFSYGGWSLYQP
jgi:hypothetical protein